MHVADRLNLVRECINYLKLIEIIDWCDFFIHQYFTFVSAQAEFPNFNWALVC